MAHFTAQLHKDGKRLHSMVGSKDRELIATVGPVTVITWRNREDTKDLIQIRIGDVVIYHGEPRDGDGAIVHTLRCMATRAQNTGLSLALRDLAEARG